MILKELAKSDVKWREMAYNICRDKTLADELVQDMYIKLHNIDKTVTDGYIFVTLRSIFYDGIRKNKKEILFEDFNRFIIEDEPYIEEPQPNYKELINDLTWYEKTMFELSTLVGQRELSRQTGIHIQTIHRVNKMVKIKLKNK
jgi:DNA-directed RNA polymerase specialized sigma24 family protein